MAEELERRGDKAIVDEDFELAVSQYSKAIDLHPENASFYVSRAAAHIKLQGYTDAVADANTAINLDPNSSKAHLRKGQAPMACFYLEEYRTARAAFEAGVALDPNSAQLKMWIRKCDAELMEEAAADKQDEGSRVSSVTIEKPSETLTGTLSSEGQTPPSDTPADSPIEAASAPTPAPLPAYRHEWYQTQNQAVVTIFAKGIKSEELTVEFGDQQLTVVIQRPEEEQYTLQLHLFDKIKASESKFNILSTKVEIRLSKAGAVNWKGLEYDPTHTVTQASAVPVKPFVKRSAKDWDKLAAEVKQAEKDEKLEGDAALNKLFQDIYRNADEDTRRAMNKSFVESNGTVLSTNWKEVGAKPVEGTPPKGMEMKKWEQ